MRLPRFRPYHGPQTCRNGHRITGDNALPGKRGQHCRTCREARLARRRPLQPGGNIPFRTNRPGVVLARGPLDYDVPVTLRCAVCGAIYERPLDAIGAPCPACQRYPEAVA